MSTKQVLVLPFTSGIKRTFYNSRLYDAALKCACSDMLKCKDKQATIDAYLKWEAFRDDVTFKEAILTLKKRLFNGTTRT